MARRSSFAYRLAQQQRELERQARLAEREQIRAVREAERARRAFERATAAEEKERKRLYLESRLAEVEALNEQLDATIAALEGLLAATLDVDDFLDFEALKETPEPPRFQPGALARAEAAPRIETFMPPELGALGKLVPGAKSKYERETEEARQKWSIRRPALTVSVSALKRNCLQNGCFSEIGDRTLAYQNRKWRFSG